MKRGEKGDTTRTPTTEEEKEVALMGDGGERERREPVGCADTYALPENDNQNEDGEERGRRHNESGSHTHTRTHVYMHARSHT